MAIALNPARAARLFAAIAAQQQTFPSEQRPSPLPRCPSCRRRPQQITIRPDVRQVDFDACGHGFTLTTQALLAGLAAQRV